MLGVVITGLAMFMVDLYGSFIALFEVRGISILIKILLLMCIPYVNEDAQIALFIIVIIFSSFVSHSTRRVRHKSFMSLAFNQKYGPQDSIKGKRK